MKKSISIILLLFAFSLLKAQVSITSQDMPSGGDTLRYSEANITQDILSKYQNTGSNYIWDFSDLEPTSQSIYEYKNAMQTPYGFYFFGSYGLKVSDSIGMGSYSIKNIYNFFKKTTSSFEANGMGLTFSGLPVPAYYQDNDEIYKFPLTYNRYDSTTFRFVTTLSGMLEYSRTGYRVNVVDGEGKITTPYGTFDCIRVKTYIYEIDSIGINTFKFGFPNHQMEYKWLAKGIKIPVLEIKGNVTMGNFTPNTLRYRDQYRKIYSPFAPVASFDADKTNVNTGETVTFFNNTTSITPATYLWKITPYNFIYTNYTDSTSEEPQVIFTKAGTYSVRLTASNNFGEDDTLRTDYITVTGGNPFVTKAWFIYDKENPTTGDDVYFTDKSTTTGSTTYLWEINPQTVTFRFTTNKNSRNPIIKFNSAGKYDVKLTVTTPYGTHDTTRSITVALSDIAEAGQVFYHVYPNPLNAGKNLLNIEFSEGGEETILALCDALGKIVCTGKSEAGNSLFSMETPELQAGIYFLKFMTGEKNHILKILVR